MAPPLRVKEVMKKAIAVILVLKAPKLRFKAWRKSRRKERSLILRLILTVLRRRKLTRQSPKLMKS